MDIEWVCRTTSEWMTTHAGRRRKAACRKEHQTRSTPCTDAARLASGMPESTREWKAEREAMSEEHTRLLREAHEAASAELCRRTEAAQAMVRQRGAALVAASDAADAEVAEMAEH